MVFSGRSREGDLAHQMARLGWLVCSLDTALPTPTDLTNDQVWDEIKKDIDEEFFQAGWIATPCGTFSPLREKPPGPRVIRTVEHITGIPEPTKEEAAQLRDSNILVHRSYKVAHKLHQQVRPWGLENPEHPPGKPSLWLMPRIKEIPQWHESTPPSSTSASRAWRRQNPHSSAPRSWTYRPSRTKGATTRSRCGHVTMAPPSRQRITQPCKGGLKWMARDREHRSHRESTPHC